MAIQQQEDVRLDRPGPVQSSRASSASTSTAVEGGGGPPNPTTNSKSNRNPADQKSDSQSLSPEVEVSEKTRPQHRHKKSGLDRTLSHSASRYEKTEGPREDGKIVLHPNEVYDELGYSFPSWKKWWILSVIFAIQCSMNFNAGAYGSAVTQLESAFDISAQRARVGQGLFLICYAFGCELWAPFSEELGRWPIMQLSLFLVNVWSLGCALSPNFASIVVFRILGGFSSAGGSVTLAYIADMYEPERQGFAVAFVVLSSVGGSVLGPIVGAFQARFLSWRWNFWLQLIFGGAVQILHFFTPETKESVLLTRIAKRRRKEAAAVTSTTTTNVSPSTTEGTIAQQNSNVYSPSELVERKWNAKEIVTTMSRPFVMFATEPIVLCLSLLSGFSDALIFTFLEAFGPVFKQWGFGTIAQGLAFIPITVGYFISYFSFWPFIHKNEKDLARDPDNFQPERRLYWLLYLAPLLSIGLFAFAWTSIGPQYGIPWIAPLLFTALVGIANLAIYFATIDYMIAAYGPYSASATGGNGFARDFLAGIATFYATPLYTNLGKSLHLAWGSTLLGFLAVLVTIPIYVFYWKGPQIRARSKFALSLEDDKKNERSRGRTQNEKTAGAAVHV